MLKDGFKMNNGASRESRLDDWFRKHRLWLGITIVALFVLESVLGSGSHTLKDVQPTGIGKGFDAGTKLTHLEEDLLLLSRDFTIEMKGETTPIRMLIWDFAAEDGDVVTIKVNDDVVADNIMITNKPVSIEVRSPSVVEVVGVQDGGGGITYGVKFQGSLDNSAYFNIANVGSSNTYTLKIHKSKL